MYIDYTLINMHILYINIILIRLYYLICFLNYFYIIIYTTFECEEKNLRGQLEEKLVFLLSSLIASKVSHTYKE